MAKPRAERWLTETFAAGVYERVMGENPRRAIPCWLAQHDPAHRLCSGPGEVFHFIPRQRVEAAMWDQLPDPNELSLSGALGSAVWSYGEYRAWRDELILLAAWDPRNGGIGCEQHHRRTDKHRVTLPSEQIIIPRAALPIHVEEFIADYGFNMAPWLEERFPQRLT